MSILVHVVFARLLDLLQYCEHTVQTYQAYNQVLQHCVTRLRTMLPSSDQVPNEVYHLLNMVPVSQSVLFAYYQSLYRTIYLCFYSNSGKHFSIQPQIIPQIKPFQRVAQCPTAPVLLSEDDFLLNVDPQNPVIALGN